MNRPFGHQCMYTKCLTIAARPRQWTASQQLWRRYRRLCGVVRRALSASSYWCCSEPDGGGGRRDLARVSTRRLYRLRNHARFTTHGLLYYAAVKLPSQAILLVHCTEHSNWLPFRCTSVRELVSTLYLIKDPPI